MNMLNMLNNFLSLINKAFGKESLPFCVMFLIFIVLAMTLNLYDVNIKLAKLERLIQITNHYDARKQLEKKLNDPGDLKKNDIIKFETICEVKHYDFCAEFRAEF